MFEFDGDIRPENTQKEITRLSDVAMFISDLDIVLEDSPRGPKDFWAHVTNVTNLFAGNLGESTVFFKKLVQEGNRSAQVVAVDIERPKKNMLESLTVPEGFRSPEFVQQDSLTYLQQAEPNSIDILTLFGAEFLFLKSEVGEDRANNNLKRLKEATIKVLKVGGIVKCPWITAFENDPRFVQVHTHTYLKADPTEKQDQYIT